MKFQFLYGVDTERQQIAEHLYLYEILYHGDPDWPASDYIPQVVEMCQKAKNYLEWMYAGVTREPGFTATMTNEEILELMKFSGMKWDTQNQKWRNPEFEETVKWYTDRDYPASMIWGE